MSEALSGIRLSPQQRRLWLLQEAHGPLAVELEADLRGPLDRAALHAALGAAVARHDVLRTSIRSIPGMRMPVQDVGGEGTLRVGLEEVGPEHHRLTLTLPAMCGDLGTLRLLLLEAAGETATDPMQYWQYSEWLNELLEESSPEDEAFWRDRLPAPEPTAMPCESGAGSSTLDAGALAAIRRTAAEKGVSTEAFLLAAWTLLLRRHLNGDVPVGVVVDGREIEELSGTPGPFARALPVHLPFRGDTPFSNLLAEASTALAEIREHQRLFTWDSPAGFPALFEHRAALPALNVAGANLTVRREHAPCDRAGVGVVCTEGPGALVFEGDEALLARFATLLASAAARPDTPAGDLDLLPAAERHRLLVDLDPPAAHLAGRCVHHLVFEQAARTPGADALVFGSRRLTYGELSARSLGLACRLRSLGVRPEVRVGLCAEPGPEALVGMLGIWGAGGAWVPVDANGPAGRRGFFLADSGARVLVTEPALATELASFPGETVVIDLAEEPGPGAPLDDGAHPESLAYVLYTSGSTGTPKGVAVEHRQLAAYLSFVDHVLFGDAVRTCPWLTPLTFDACLKQVLSPLLRGEVVWGFDEALDPPVLLRELAGSNRVGINGTPTLWRAVLQELEHPGSAGSAALPGVARVFLGGERLSPDLLARTAVALPGAEVWNLYGPTEATANALAARLDPGGPVVLGRPIEGARVFLLDRRLQPVPPGVAGEIFVGGAGVARGYLERPALTAERFLPDPFSGEPGARLYRTGDLGRLGPDGSIEFLGRTDHQVKLRGFRIELGEIESRLELCQDVREAAVLAEDDGAGGLRLTAWVVPERGTLHAPDLRSALREALPEHMVPAAFVVLDRLPRLPSGKVDRAALPGLVSEVAAERPFVAPRTPAERRLAAIWAEVLGRESVSVEDNFFELGGHSIQSIQISHRATAAGLALSPRDLLHHPTIAELAVRATGMEKLPEIVAHPEARFEPFLLSEIQQAYLVGRTGLFELGGVGPTSYLEAEWPELDVPRLEAAWRRLVERHDMLRAVARPDAHWQVLEEVPRYRVGVLDLRGMDPETVRQELATVREEMSSHPFEPDCWPLFELCVSRLDGGRARLHVARDLLIGDARSNDVILQELMALYRDPGAELPPLAVSIRDYALAVDALRDHAAGQRAQAYWRARLADLPPAPDLPLSPRPGSPAFVRRHAEIAPDAWARLNRRAGQAGVTPSVLLCAAFAEVLAAWSRGDRFSINVLYSRRLPLHPDVDRLVGNFSSTVLLEVDGRMDGRETTFERRAVRLQHRLWDDLEHGLVSGVEVLREANRLQGGSTRAAMPVVFSSVLPLTGTPAASGTPELIFSSVQTPQVALEVLVAEVAGTVRCTWNAVEDAFPPGFVAAMFEAFGELLHSLAKGEEAWQSTARIPVPAIQLTRRREVNDTAGPEPGWLLHEPVDLQAELRPGETAVVAPDRRLTYGEMSRQADRLARELRRLGAQPGRLVAVVLEKGWEQAVAVLAVLRAGAAYLPVDPALPLERRRLLLEQGDVEIVLAQPRMAGRPGWPQGVRVLAVDGTESTEEEPLDAVQTRDDLAYVLFTSGSTGVPKGVMIEHRGAANTVAEVNRCFGIGPADRVLALSSLSFDLSVWDLFGVLGAGGRVVMPGPEESRDPACWHELVMREGVTVWNSVPALVELYAEHLERHGERWPASLRLVLMSGDWIPVGLPARIRALGARAALISLGGATEASIWSILFAIGEVDPEQKSIPYGRPMRNQTFQVLDERLEPCPDWVAGELCIGGLGLARGYWKDEERTRESFVIHPRTGERLYRTGDLGRWRTDGHLEILGRVDLQVKIQGYRVELGEVETVLAEHPAVRDAVVTAVGEARGHKRLAAWWVPRDGQRWSVEAAELRAWLEARLPDYMVPHLYIPLEALPLTANGKVDRRSLPAPEPPRRRWTEPRTPTEQRMARLWETVLGVSRVGLRDELFALGGDSMLALRLLAEIEKAFGCRLPLAALFQEATVERLSALVEGCPAEVLSTGP